MRSAVRLLLLLVVLLGSRRLALAKTDEDKFQARVGRSAPTDIDITLPVICVCKDGSSHNNQAGQLLQFPQSAGAVGFEFVHVTCAVLEFGNGAHFAQTFCETWDLLPK